MTEKELIAKIKELKQIKPRKEWAVLSKQRILDESPVLGRERVSTGLNGIIEGIRIIFNHKYAFATLTAVFVLIGVFGLSQSSLPGNLLYSVRKITEQGQRPFVSEDYFSFKIANSRLSDLGRVIQNNAVNNLAPAINEYKASISEVAKNIIKEGGKDPNAVGKIVKEVKNIEKRTEEIKSLGIEIGQNVELDSALVQLIQDQVRDLQDRTLTEEQKESLDEVKSALNAGNYSEALEKLLLLQK